MSQDQELINELRNQVDQHATKMEESRNMWLERIQWYEERWEEMEERLAEKKKRGGGGRGSGRGGGNREEYSEEEEEEDDDDYDSEDEDKENESDCGDDDGVGGENGCRCCHLLQQRIDAANHQIKELETSLLESEECRVSAEERAKNAESKLATFQRISAAGNESSSSGQGGSSSNDVVQQRDARIKLAESERTNRDLQRQVDSMKQRVADYIQLKERATSSQRRVAQLEKEISGLTRQVEEGKEIHRRWMEFRKVIVDESFMLLDKNEGGGVDDVGKDHPYSSAVPPEIATVISKFNYLKRQIQAKESEIARITQMSEKHLRRAQALETQLNDSLQSVSTLEMKVKDQETMMDSLQLENRKIVAQQHVWKREADGLRSLLDTYELQEVKTMQSNKSSSLSGKSKSNSSSNAEGLQLSLNSAREEIQLLSETNTKLEATIAKLREEQQASKTEHEQVLVKFGKLRNAVFEERAKAEKAEARACQAETLAGKGMYNSDETRVLHLKCNPAMDAVREKYQLEIDSLKRKLGEVGADGIAAQGDGTTTTMTPAPAKDRGSLDSSSSSSRGGTTSDSVDIQKLHSRLKEQFRNQIALFRQGVYLITGFKFDMTQDSENDCQIFTVRSVYGEREEDHLKFKWSPKKKTKLDIMNTDMAQLLLKGSSGVYVKEHGSWPGFMASVTLQLFDQQTVL